MPNGRVLTKPRYTEIRSEHPMFLFVERICIAFFTIEYSLRLFATYKKLRFIVKPLNLVDLLAIIPFYLELFLTVVGVDETKLRDLRWAFLVVRILRVLRVIRIIKAWIDLYLAFIPDIFSAYLKWLIILINLGSIMIKIGSEWDGMGVTWANRQFPSNSFVWSLRLETLVKQNILAFIKKIYKPQWPKSDHEEWDAFKIN